MNGLNMNDAGEVMVYEGTALKGPQEISGRIISPYLPDENLIDAVNLSIFLQRPLLLVGDPGCGKTRLAEAVAYDLYGKNYRNYYFRWDVKSTSKAKDGLYRYDALSRLRDAQLGKRKKEEEEKESHTSEEKIEEKEIIRQYITDGPLGEALKKSTKEKPTILLIDEIDKADIDFPNDLLIELDEGTFKIEESGEEFSTGYPPIVFITSNREKELPAPFLRRCLFHHIDFPSKEQLTDILFANFFKIDDKFDLLVDKAVKAFLLIRSTMQSKLAEADKKVSTGELLDWFKMINYYYYKNRPVKIALGERKIIDALEETIKELHETGTGRIPFYQALLKNWESHVSILAALEEI